MSIIDFFLVIFNECINIYLRNLPFFWLRPLRMGFIFNVMIYFKSQISLKLRYNRLQGVLELEHGWANHFSLRYLLKPKERKRGCWRYLCRKVWQGCSGCKVMSSCGYWIDRPCRDERNCGPKTWGQQNFKVLMWSAILLKEGVKDMVMPVWSHNGCWTTELSPGGTYECGGSEVVLLVGETTR